jgi:hypothetical protein
MATSSTGAGSTIRSPWNVVSWTIAVVTAITGAATVSSGVGLNQIDTAISGVVMLVPGAWGTLRVPFMRVTCAARGVTIHGLVRNRTVKWVDIRSVEIGELDSMITTAYAPELARNGNLKPILLTQLARYGTKRVKEQVAVLEHLRATHAYASQ